jgi:hypothetical protein
MPVRARFDRRRAELEPEALEWLHDGDGGVWIYFHWQELGQLWREHADAIVAEHVAESPGTRPVRWWQYSAPRAQPGDYKSATGFHEGLPLPRRRLGGVGTPAHEVLAHAPAFWRGVPSGWISRWDVAYYNGRALDVHGQPILNGYKDGDFAGVAMDPRDPPMFEAEATYLDRMGLLLPGEHKRLKQVDFAPESILELIDFGDKSAA